ncbi:DEKNAAC103238 [Brettanomyces naardenensis]|uniref:DEKNAAC103238 n=1 Tax=Brettanomyces naardenensis TaxID=13370 RepID=A0A448YMQ7_BRENA|nr:DEKNAAC103238 [Brettanomyces naardenensis]
MHFNYVLLFATYVCAMAVPPPETPGVNQESEFKEDIPAEFKGSWQKWHMKVEHDLDDADVESIFKLHDTRNVNKLSAYDILRMYGLARDEVVGEGNGMGSHDNTEIVGKELKEKVIKQVLALMDKNHDGEISLEEWKEYSGNGGEFPDFGLGSGHEYDFEEEYEKHHWLKYHSEDDPDVKVQHAEDIEHELLHHFHEIEHEAKANVYNVRAPIRIEKIPARFIAQ